MFFCSIKIENDIKLPPIEFFGYVKLSNENYLVRINSIDSGFLLRFVSKFVPKNKIINGDNLELFRGEDKIGTVKIRS